MSSDSRFAQPDEDTLHTVFELLSEAQQQINAEEEKVKLTCSDEQLRELASRFLAHWAAYLNREQALSLPKVLWGRYLRLATSELLLKGAAAPGSPERFLELQDWIHKHELSGNPKFSITLSRLAALLEQTQQLLLLLSANMCRAASDTVLDPN